MATFMILFKLCVFPGGWSSHAFSGTSPPPTGAFTLTSIDEHRALMFGGTERQELKRVSNLYLIDFQKMVNTLVH